VLGLVPVIPVVGSILAIVFGMVAEKQINEIHNQGGHQGGRGFAIAGTVLGLLELILLVVVWIIISVHDSSPASLSS
jgi:uncharacterized membrane protein